MNVVVDSELLQAAVAAIPEDLLTPLRRAAAAEFARSGFPTTRHEDWKYTNLDPVVALSNAWLTHAPGDRPSEQISSAAKTKLGQLAEQIDAHWLIVCDGKILTPKEDILALNGQGVEIRPLSEDLPDAGLFVDDSIARFNVALLRNGYRIRARAGNSIAKPLGLFITADSADTPSVAQNRFVIDVEENAQIKIVQAFWSADGHSQFTNAITEIDVARGARADLVQLQESGDRQSLISALIARLHQASVFNHNSFDLGGALVRNDIKVDISGRGAETTLHGLYLAREDQHIDNHTRVDHRVGPAKSNELYRGVLGHRSRCVFNGKALVHVGADGTDANQANHNLLLSHQAEVDTKPELEIYADDVKCSHGATVGQLDQAALFYLRTRGLAKADATAVLTRSFAASVLAGLAVEECRDYVSQRIDEQLDLLIGESNVKSEPDK